MSEPETFDMGTFELENQAQNKSFPDEMLVPPMLNEKNVTKPMVKQVMKEVMKTTSRKSDEEVKDHQSLVIMLSRYGQSKRFSDYLKSMNFNLSVTHLKGLDTPDLEELLQRVKTSIDNKNTSAFWEDLAFGVIQTAEVITTSTNIGKRIKIQGLTEALKGDETMLDLIEQIELENQNLAYTSPYVRLVYSIATSAMKVHSINTMMAKRMDILNEPDQIEPDEHKETHTTLAEPHTTLAEPKKPHTTLVEPKKPQVISFD